MITCSVSNCKSVFTRTKALNPERIGFFRVPKNSERRKLWERLLKQNRPFGPNDRVCSLHFPIDCVARYYESKLSDGTVQLLPRANLSLKADALPTIVPDSSKIPVTKNSSSNSKNRRKSTSRSINDIEQSPPRSTDNHEKSTLANTDNRVNSTSRVTEDRDFTLQDQPPALHVYLRVKPTPSFENATEIVDNKLICRPPIQSKAYNDGDKSEFTFARIFDADTSQQEVFRRTLLPCVCDLIRSRNSLVFSYGTVNSGKTYTIQGNIANPGLIPRTLHAIFSKIAIEEEIKYVPDMGTNVNRISVSEGVKELQRLKDLFKAHPSMKMYETQFHRLSQMFDDYSDYEMNSLPKCSMWVSFVELHNETVYDLLEPITDDARPHLKLCADDEDNFHVKGLKQFCVKSAAEAYATYMFGRHNFNTSCTKVNKTASRSHCIFIIKLVNLSDPEFLTVSRLSICDLAGSGKPKEARSNEWKSIDLSLFMLNRCLKTLRDNQIGETNQTMPYRSAKLTQLLCSVLTEKNSEKVTMIVNINPSPDMYDETIEVLKVSSIARQIRRNPNTNEKAIKRHRRLSASRQYSNDVNHRLYGLEMSNHEEESNLENADKHVMQQKIEQLKEEVKQKEGQIEEIHTKYQEMLRYLVKFHEEEVCQIKRESQQEADQRIHAIKAYYDLKINEISSTNNTSDEMALIEDTPTSAKLNESITRLNNTEHTYDDMETDLGYGTVEEPPRNILPQYHAPNRFTNKNLVERNANAGTSSMESTVMTNRRNAFESNQIKNNYHILKVNDSNSSKTPSIQTTPGTPNQYKVMASSSSVNTSVISVPVITTSPQAANEKKFKIIKITNSPLAGKVIPVIKTTSEKSPATVVPVQVIKNVSNLKTNAANTPENGAAISRIHVFKSTPSQQANKINCVSAANAIKSPVGSSFKVIRPTSNVKTNLVNSISPVKVTSQGLSSGTPQLPVLKAVPNQINAKASDEASSKKPVTIGSSFRLIKVSPSFKSNQINAVSKTANSVQAQVPQRSVYEAHQNLAVNQANVADKSPTLNIPSVSSHNIQMKSKAPGVVVIQVKLDGKGERMVGKDAHKNVENVVIDESNGEMENSENETCPKENNNQSLSASQHINPSVSTDQTPISNEIDGDTQMITDQDNVKDNDDDVLVISDDSDSGASYKGIDEAQIVIPPNSSWHTQQLAKFTCSYCGKTFNRSYRYRLHVNTHLNIKPFKCDECSAAYTEKRYLMNHKKIHAMGKKAMKCDYCDHSYVSDLTLRKHINANHGRKMLKKCDLCEKTFVTEIQLQNHLNQHISIELSKNESTNEMEEKDGGENYISSNSVGPIQSSVESRKIMSKICEYCGKKFSSSFILKTHERKHLCLKPYKCIQCYKTFVNKQELSRHASTHSSYKKYPCGKCDKEFFTPSALRSHRRTHLQSKPFKCDQCSMRFHTKETLQRHESVHSKGNSFKCILCSEEFISKESLEEHTNIHLGIESHRCDQCGETFAGKSTFEEHMKKHLPEFFQCTECDKKFNEESLFKSHMTMHLGLKSYKCKICKKKFYSRLKLRCHKIKHKAHKSQYKCPRCCKSYSSRTSLRIHNERQHRGLRLFKCLACCKKFAFIYDLKKHAIQCNVKTFDCRTCGCNFTTKLKFKQHQKLHVNLKTSESPTADIGSFAILELNHNIPNILDDKSFKCEECGKGFVTKSRLSIHIKRHTGFKPFQCDSCVATFYTRAELQQHTIRHLNVKEFKCDECGGEFYTKSDLKQHKIRKLHKCGELNSSNSVRRSSSNLFKCLECDSEFHFQTELRRHLLAMHPGVKTYECSLCCKKFFTHLNLSLHMKRHSSKSLKCSECDAAFFYPSELEYHKRVKHLKIKPYTCAACNKGFAIRRNLKAHLEKVHLGITSYKCKKCDEKFTNRAELRRHYDIHVPESAKPYRCNECNQKFRYALHLKKHTRSHSLGVRRYKCSQCKPMRKFSSVNNFVCHMRKHLGMKPFTCNYCDKTFASQGNLKYHIEKHLGLKTHECKECGKMFNAYSSLYQHYRVHYKPFQCDICKRFFAQKFSLSLHIIRIHNKNAV